MSIYLDEKNPSKHKPFQDASQDIVDYVRYLEVIAGKSPNTAFNYYCDLRNFSKFMKQRKGLVSEDAPVQEIDPKGLDTAFWGSVTKEDIYEDLYYLNQIIIPEAIYTVAVTLVVYPLLLFINHKLEAEEKRSASKFV